MTVLTPNQDPKQSINSNNDHHQDTHSTTDMIFSENGQSSFRQLSNARIISATLIIVTLLMGFFLLSAIYIQTASRCVCAYGPGMYQQESRDTPYFEPLKALSSEGTSKEMRNFPLRIHMNDPKSFLNGENNGRVSCEVTRKTASQVIASEPKEIQTPLGNVTTDPKLLHLTGEKLFFTCYNGEKPKPVVLIARPRIFAIFHRRTPDLDSNSTETDDSSSSSENGSNESNGKDEQPSVAAVAPTGASKEENNGPLVRNRRDTTKQMECACSCPIKKD